MDNVPQKKKKKKQKEEKRPPFSASSLKKTHLRWNENAAKIDFFLVFFFLKERDRNYRPFISVGATKLQI